MMSKGILAALMGWWCLGAVGPVPAQQTAVVFPMNSIEHVDVRNQLLTFKSQDGQLRILRVAEWVGITRTSFAKGDLVRIEVDLDDRITTIVKVPQPPSDRRAARFR
ncbi:MAG TPA: hypothetical protein PKV55_11905 [Nitrospira sp.]|jgi:hypothetical protein|nr:hypothetical protein [Nitrospira sp.]MCC7471837.1 hypothetical protein [Candidatus Nomurabacteria bacterium]MBS0161695.1 hypothetical protein [Nitrospira sp.]MBS0173136.1 hypothetical protein [Nitrospira sp.]MBX3338662.1 hypothetical protein [Nitrospira sp.]